MNLNIRQAAQQLGLSRERVNRLVNSGQLKFTIEPTSGWKVIDSQDVLQFQRTIRPPGRPRKNKSKIIPLVENNC